MKKIFGLAAPLSIIATTAFAADTAVGKLEPYGNISLLSFTEQGDGDSLNMWVVDFGIRLPSLITSGPLTYGFYVGYDGLDSVPTDSVAGSGYGTAAVTLEAGPHLVSVGVPRSVIHDTFGRGDVTSTILQDSDVFFSDWTRLTRLSTGVSHRGMSSIYGLRYDGHFDKTALSVGLFSGDFVDENMQSMQATLKHEIGRLSFRAGLERLHGGYTMNSYLLGTTAQFDKLSVGLDVFVFNMQDSNLKSAQMFGSYKISENILVGASYLVADEAADSLKSSTLGIEYAQSNGTYARLTGLFGSGDGADSDAYELAVGLRF
jgi:hypothetical protein